MIVDVHTHIWDSLEQLGPASNERLRQRHDPPWTPLDGSFQGHDHAMQPVRYAFILGLMSLRINAHIPAQRIAAYVARRPDRYLGFAGIDPTAPNWPDIFAQVLDLRLAGVVISPATQGCAPTDPRAMRLLERCAQHRLPVIVHPDTHLARADDPSLLSPRFFAEVARALPELHLVIAQLGWPHVNETLDLLDYHPHVYADLSDLASRPGQLRQALLAAHERGVASKLLMGSDYPFSTPQRAIANLYATHTAGRGLALAQIPRETIRGIVERDALACLGISPPPAALAENRDLPQTASKGCKRENWPLFHAM